MSNSPSVIPDDLPRFVLKSVPSIPDPEAMLPIRAGDPGQEPVA
jgi:hypothetical protein